MVRPVLQFVGLVAVTGAISGVVTLVAVAVLPDDASTARRSVAKRTLIGFAHLVGIAGLIVTGVWEPLLEALVEDAPPLDPAVAGIGVFVLGSLVALPGVVLSNLLPAMQRAGPDSEGSYRSLLAMAGTDSVGVAGFLAIGVLVFVGMVSAPHPAVAIVVPVLAGFAGAQLLAYGTLWGQPTRDPTETELAVIEQPLDRTGFPMERVHVIVDRPEVEIPRPFVKGLPPRAHVFVPERSFERMDPDVLETTLLALTTPSPFRYLRIVVRFLLLGVLATMFLHFDALALYTGGSPSPAVYVLTVYLIGTEAFGFAVGRRLVFRGDQRLAGFVGDGQVRDTLAQQLALAGGEDLDALTRFLLLVPSVEQRLQRLGSDEVPADDERAVDVPAGD